MHLSNVVHMTSVHSEDDVRVFYKECRTLVLNGYNVFLIAPAKRPTTVCDQVDGVSVHVLRRQSTRWRRLSKTIPEVYRAAVYADADIYHFHDPELIPVGLLLKLRGKRVIYDVHENLPLQIHSKIWIPSLLRTAVAFATDLLERISSHAFDGIVTATPTIAQRFPPAKTISVQNFALPEEMQILESHMYLGRTPGTFLYVGGITKARGAFEMTCAIRKLPPELNARLIMAGPLESPELVRLLATDSPAVQILGGQRHAAIVQLLSEARVGMLTLHPTRNHLDALPVKLFEYMSAGIPVIASDFPLWRSIIEDAGCGLLVDPEDPDAIAAAMFWMIEHPEEAEHMGRCGRDMVIRKYNWNTEAEKLVGLYQALTARVTSIPERASCAE